MNIWDRVCLLCDENNVSKRQVSLACGMDASAISKWKGRSPNSKSVKAVADYFDVDVDWLLGKSDVRKSEQRIYYNDDVEVETQDLSDDHRTLMKAIPGLPQKQVKLLLSMVEQLSDGNE